VRYDPLHGPLGVKGLNWYEVITRQNHFNTNNEILIQRKRMAMGKPTSGLISEFFQQNLQHLHLTHPSNKHQIINYIRYVDNILLIFDSNHTNIQKHTNDFNAIHPSPKFTAETEANNSTNYLRCHNPQDPTELEDIHIQKSHIQ